MNPIRPYSLSFDEQSSSDYYKGIAAFTDGWQPHARQISAHWTNDFLAFQRRRALPLRSADECALEFLTIGVLLREHGEEAANLSGRSAWLLSRLVRLQERAPWAEQPVKALRGLIGGLRHIWRAARGRLYSDVWALRRLIVWLNALGETTQAARLA
ncbi:MAG TPA: hypothetical protein VHO48_01815, partial [Anaerolineaceae bacterium]|nr:hypothetical protein [Anaerolineaceae bacterium]